MQAYNVNEGYLNLDDRGLLFKVASIVLDQLFSYSRSLPIMAGPLPSSRTLPSGDFQGRAYGDLKNRLWTTTIDRPTYH